MKALHWYLNRPQTRQVLSRKPGQAGFSLIELVVVVAVLAILAAIAVPAYMNMNQQAADAAAVTNLKNAYKECAYQITREQNNNSTTNPEYDKPQDDGYWEYTSSGSPLGTCATAASGTVQSPVAATVGVLTAEKVKGGGTGHESVGCIITVDLVTGDKTETTCTKIDWN